MEQAGFPTNRCFSKINDLKSLKKRKHLKIGDEFPDAYLVFHNQ